MPVVTRNQYKNSCSSVIKEVKKQTINPVIRPNINNLLPSWLFVTLCEGYSEINKLYDKKTELRSIINTTVSSKNKNALEKQFRILHYDRIRYITELMYITSEYLPQVVSIYHGLSKFIIIIYNKIQEFYLQIRENEIKPETVDEYKVTAAFVYTLQDTEKSVLPFLPSEFKIKRNHNCIDYIKMDTIESVNEYDGITNILEDVTIDVVPDYKPSDQEEELSVCQENNIFVKSKNNVQKFRKVWKSNNHILFEYDN